MTAVIAFFNLGIPELIILAVLGLGAVAVAAAVVFTVILGSQTRPPEEDDRSE